MEQSILTSMKKISNIPEADTSFDLDMIMHINAIFDVLYQIGVGPADGFMIEDASATWDSFLGDEPRKLNLVRTYVGLRVRLIFDPPNTSYVIDAMKNQINEFEWRLNVQREGESWVDPTLPVEV